MRRQAALVIFLAIVLFGQRFRFDEDEAPRPNFPRKAEFNFIRVEYTDLPEFHRGFGYASRRGTGDGWWVVDWPEAMTTLAYRYGINYLIYAMTH